MPGGSRSGWSGAAVGWATTISVFAIALIVFLLLPQRSLHGMDADYFVVWLEQGELQYPRHVAYLHFCSWLHQLLQPLGLSAYRALLLASALGTALGLALVHRAGLLLLRGHRLDALAVTVATGLTPAWFYFGTCAEIPGVFMFGAGLAWWTFARWMVAPSLARAAVLGLACALAGAIHSFGHLLSPTFVAFAAALRWPEIEQLSRRHRRLHLVVLVLAQAIAALSTAVWFGVGAGGQAADVLHHLEERWETFAPQTTGAVFVREWLLPYLPWSVLALLALSAPRSRRWGLAVLCGLLIHLPLSVLLLGYIAADEVGAYQVGLAPAAVLAALALLPRLSMWLLIAIGAGVAIGFAAPNWPEPVAPEFVQGVGELRAERPFLLVVGRRHELDGVRTAVEDVMVIELSKALGVYLLAQDRGTRIQEWFDGWFTSLDAMGTPVLLSRSARLFFERNQDPGLRAFWNDHLQRNYRLVPERRQGFAGTWVLAPN